MLASKRLAKLLALLGSLVALALVAAACGGDDATPTPTATSQATATATATATTVAYVKYEKPGAEIISFQDSAWATLWEHNAIAMYIVEHGYGYPVEEIQGTTGTMQVALPLGDVDVLMEIWRFNIPAWYDTVTAAGTVVDLAGTGDTVAVGAPGQVLKVGVQGFYIPTYTAEANPGLVSVSDLPNYVDLFTDPEDPTKGVVFSCLIDWACHKLLAAKWFAYGLYDTYNVTPPGTSGAMDANITGAYVAGEDILAFYWEPSSIISLRDMTRLEEPAWTQTCQDALDVAVVSAPYESTIGCGYAADDIHVGVYSGLVARAPEVTDFLTNLFVGGAPLGTLEVWKIENDKTWQEAGVHYLQTNRDVWTTWITDANAAEIVARVDAALAAES